MKKYYRLFATMLVLVGLLAACGNQEAATNEPVELTISAAASLQDALEELKTTYEQQHDTIKILYNFEVQVLYSNKFYKGLLQTFSFQQQRINLMRL